MPIGAQKNDQNIHSDWQSRYEALANEHVALKEYSQSFPQNYQHDFSPETALTDVELFVALEQGQLIAQRLYRNAGEVGSVLRFRVVQRDEPIALSDILPILEHFGLRVIGERPYQIENQHRCVWLHDFELSYENGVENLDEVAERFEDAFSNVWDGNADSDAFNGLVLGVGLDWRSTVVFRGYANYMKQIKLAFTRPFVAKTLSAYPELTKDLWRLFEARFKPSFSPDLNLRKVECELISQRINEGLDAVNDLTQDQIIRQYLTLLHATLRTSFYRMAEGRVASKHVAFKFEVGAIPQAPKPKPLYEIFVYSPEIEGVHLRGGKVARGGLRWSDRREDYRTEVLGLVKAQQVKNAVIVPMGAKGGFICKREPENNSREAFIENGMHCYRVFISSLLEITDNLVEGSIVEPENVMRWDGDDPYLVVAADKGTATFSDIANDISLTHGFWLGDAFASGGSVGYDHKKMGITAKGAWVSVQRHFRELGIDVQSEDFSAVAVGDMGGDVFGNGMLCSEHICLKAAFNHLHIFIDPNPNANASYSERKRLFEADASGWDQYNADLISEGGGVFSRSAKSIVLTPQIKASFGLEADELTPNELIKAILQSPFDLLWNGGIGTYMKAQSETHAEVGDKANDSLRVNGNELGARVVGEGGNLGCTQLGRVEYSLNGGRCNTDFIDNAGGVDCSDHEVNIKILLQQLMEDGVLNESERINLLEAMTGSVSELVLQNNYRQAQAISLAEFEADARDLEYQRLISSLESSGALDRELEFIPSDEVIQERKSYGKYLSRPELAVLVSYTKLGLKQALSQSTIAGDASVAHIAHTAFPPVLVEQYAQQVDTHQLVTDIVATQLANEMVNRMGITFVHRMQGATGETEETIAKAYTACRELFDIESQWRAIEQLDHNVASEIQSDMFVQLVRLVRRSTRWLLREYRSKLDVKQVMNEFSDAVAFLSVNIETMLDAGQLESWSAKVAEYVDAGVPQSLAQFVATARYYYMTFSIAKAATNANSDIPCVAQTYYLLGDALQLNWFSEQIKQMGVDSYWSAMARESFRDDLESEHEDLVEAVILSEEGNQQSVSDCQQRVEHWLDANQAYVDRWLKMTAELRSVNELDFAMFPVALRELVDLSEGARKGLPNVA